MSLSLVKSANVSLTKEAPAMKICQLGLGWDPRVTDGQAFDLDCSVFMLNDTNKVISNNHFIYFNNLMSPCGAVIHCGDNLTGEGAGDDETVVVDFDKVPAEVRKIVFAVTIYEAKARKQNFGQVGQAYIRILDKNAQVEVTRFDLSEDAAIETAMIFGELYRHDDEWRFKALGQGFEGDLSTLIQAYGVY